MNELTRQDYLRIKWSFVAILGSILICVGIFALARTFDTRATAALKTARTAFDEAKQKVDKISEEEATIKANIGKFAEIRDARLVGKTDRLQINEYFSELRAEHNLSPISFSVGKEAQLSLVYGAFDGKKPDKPGRPISLNVSPVTFKLPLLHEQDLAKLLNGLLGKPEFLQTQMCKINNLGKTGVNSLRLGQNLDAECSLAWYSFQIDETKTAAGKKK